MQLLAHLAGNKSGGVAQAEGLTIDHLNQPHALATRSEIQGRAQH